ncbi:MAG TPA: hypothetical protein V6D07_11155 [Trichocoleus sp.]
MLAETLKALPGGLSVVNSGQEWMKFTSVFCGDGVLFLREMKSDCSEKQVFIMENNGFKGWKMSFEMNVA